MSKNEPHRTLGLATDATQAEIKRAYRRLAKQYHPDSGGERSLTRFLAIQAAYESLVRDEPGGGGSRASRGGSRPPEPPPWQADPARARATREAYRTRRRSPGGAGPAAGRGPSDRGPAEGGPVDRADGPQGSGARTGDGASGRMRRPLKATIGSTSYDGADREPFDPVWDGATWYGAGSGTYWTINPKEYADPRKHGPEYLARSRRPAVTGRRAGSTEQDPPRADPPPDGAGPRDRASADAATADAPGAPPSGGSRADARPDATILGRLAAALGLRARVR